MSAPISIIIPTFQAADTVGPCLGAIGEALFEGVVREVIIVDGGSTDMIAEVADATGAEFLSVQRGRGTQLAAGAEAARGAWLLFLHADSVLGPDWVDSVRRHMAEHPGKAGYFRLAFDVPGTAARWTARWGNLRARLLGLPYGDQGLLISQALYAKTGGFPDQPLMEDVAMARSLTGRLAPMSSTITTSAERYQKAGWLRRGRRNLWTLIRYFCGVSPEVLARGYERP